MHVIVLSSLVVVMMFVIVNSENATPTTTTTTTTTLSTLSKVLPARGSVTRTALHVARSLDPDATQTLSVRTKSGEMATLIVKRRDSKKLVPAPVNVRSKEMAIHEEEQNKEQRSNWKDPLEDLSNNPWTRLTTLSSSSSSSSSSSGKDEHTQKQIGNDKPRWIPRNEQQQVPNPISIRSSDIWVKGVSSRWKNGRGLVRVGTDGIPEVTGIRMPDDEIDKHQVWRNARVIDNKLFPTTSKPNTRLTRKLHYPGHVVYRASQLYSRPSQVSFEEGVRTPVLQYAHPELGVQPARASASEVLAAAYKAQDPQPQSYGEPEPPFSHTFITYQQHLERERPFWEKISDAIKEHVQTGMETVTSLTRPVVEPLVEATHKISRNLGLGRPVDNSNSNQMEVDRVGLAAAPTYPVLLPALGLVAGGAALGLGAVAVGRYLDSDLVKQRNDHDEEDDEDLTMEHKRAMEAATTTPSEQFFQARLIYNNNNNNNANGMKLEQDKSQIFQTQLIYDEKRKKRSVTFINDNKILDSFKAASHNSDQQIAAIAKIGMLTDWTDTECAKYAFCSVLTRQGGDPLFLMEKKMQSFLAIIPADNPAIYHLNAVMAAVKRHDCSSFRCYSNRRVPALLAALPR